MFETIAVYPGMRAVKLVGIVLITAALLGAGVWRL